MKKNKQNPRIIFIDFKSKNNNHLSGNLSFIYKIIKYSIDKSKFNYFYCCNRSAESKVIEWRNKLNLNNLTVLTQKVKYKKSDIVFILYPEYLQFFNYISIKLNTYLLITISHGHLNSLGNLEKNSLYKYLKNNYKKLFFNIFDRILSYSEHIYENAKDVLPFNLQRKLSIINEITEIPSKENIKIQNNLNKNKIIIGFLKYPKENLQKYFYRNLKNNKKQYEIKKGWEYDLADLSTYLNFISSCDILVCNKMHHYELQVSGVISDCLSLGVVPLCSKNNLHFRFINKKAIKNKNISLEYYLEDFNNIPLKEELEEIKNKLSYFNSDLKKKNSYLIKEIFKSKQILISYQGNLNGGGLIDQYRFYWAINNEISTKFEYKNVLIFNRERKAVKSRYLSKKLFNMQKNIIFTRNILNIVFSKITNILFVQPNIKDSILLLIIKLFKKDINCISIIHNPPNHQSSNNKIINITAKLTSLCFQNLSNEIIFLSKIVSQKWNLKYSKRVVHLPILPYKNWKLNKSKGSIVKQNDSTIKVQLLIVGRYLEYKNLKLLTDSINSNLLNTEHKLSIVGKDYPLEQINKLNMACKKKNWKFKYESKFLFMEDMIKSIKKADFLLFLYTSGSQPGFMVLANELNIPTICTNVGALKENQENGGRGYCIKPNVKELVNILNILGVKEQNKIPEFKPYKDKIITKY